MKKKGAQALSAGKASKLPRAVLLVGPDAGLLDSISQDLIAGHKKRQPHLGVERMDDVALKAHPDKLAAFMGGSSLFGDVALVHVQLNGETQAGLLLEALSALDGADPEGPVLLIEAAKVNKKGKLAQWFEASAWAWYLETYEATSEALSAYAVEVAREEAVRFSQHAVAHLLEMVSQDYASVRAEVQKLALYVGKDGTIDEEAIAALASDSRHVALDDVLDAAFGGRPSLLATSLPQCFSQGVAPVLVLNGVARRARQFYHIRALVDDGAGLMELLADRRFGVHFERQGALAAQLRLWSARMLANVIGSAVRLDQQLKTGGVAAEIVLDHFLTRMAHRLARIRQARER